MSLSVRTDCDTSGFFTGGDATGGFLGREAALAGSDAGFLGLGGALLLLLSLVV